MPSWRASRGTVDSKAAIYTMEPVGFPGNLPPHRCLPTSHTSLKKEEEEGGGPPGPVTLTPSCGPLAIPLLGVWEQQAGRSEAEVGRAGESELGSRDFRVSGAGRWGDRRGSGTLAVLG